MGLNAVDTRSAAQAYLTKPNIVVPSTQAVADALEVTARAEDTALGKVNGPGSATVDVSGTLTRVERNVLVGGS